MAIAHLQDFKKRKVVLNPENREHTHYSDIDLIAGFSVLVPNTRARVRTLIITLYHIHTRLTLEQSTSQTEENGKSDIRFKHELGYKTNTECTDRLLNSTGYETEILEN